MLKGFIQAIKKQAFAIAILPINVALPITYKRYDVDDSHDRFHMKQYSEISFNILNSIDLKIQFTAEYEDANKRLNFLDTTVINKSEGRYEFNQ